MLAPAERSGKKTAPSSPMLDRLHFTQQVPEQARNSQNGCNLPLPTCVNFEVGARQDARAKRQLRDGAAAAVG